MPATVKIPAEFTAIDKFSHIVGKMVNSTKGFATTGVAAVKRFDAKVSSVFNKMGRLTQLALGIGIGALFLNGVDDIKAYETGLVGVGKTTGIVGQPLKDLGADIIKTSDALRGISTHKLLELGQTAGQLGISGSEDILRFSTTLAKLEKASDIQGEEGASSIARLLTITGEGVGVVDRFASALVGLGNTSAATESEILGTASEVARATAAYKLQSTQILGISTALKSLDVRPEAAGTAVGKVFKGIENATLKGGKTLKTYADVMGLTSQEAKDVFSTDKVGAFKLLIKGLNGISEKGGSVQKTMNDLGLSGEIVGKGIIPLATNYGLLEEKLAMANKGFEDNLALNQEFDAASKTVQTALDSIKNAFANVLIKSADTGSNLETVQTILFMVADNMDLVVVAGASLIGMYAAMKAIVWGSQVAMVAYNVALGVHGALSGVASINIGKNAVALAAYRTAMVLGTAGTWLATAATTAFGIALNLGLWPITLIIAAIAGLIALFYNWDSVTEWFGKQWERFTNWIGELWDGVVSWFQEFSFMDFFKNIGQSILKFMLLPMQGVLTLLSKIPGKIGDMASMGLDKIGEMTGEIDANVNGDGNPPLDSPELNTAKMTQETIQRNTVAIDINDPGNNVSGASNKGPMEIPINLTKTQGAW